MLMGSLCGPTHDLAGLLVFNDVDDSDSWQFTPQTTHPVGVEERPLPPLGSLQRAVTFLDN